MLTRFLLISIVATLVGAGWYQLDRFSSTPGDQEAAPEQWPHGLMATSNPVYADSDSERDLNTPKLLVFLHPRCSCSAATLAQLGQILDSTRSRVSIILVVYRSKAISDAADTPTFHGFRPGESLHRSFRILADMNGGLARRFGAATSGEIVLYSSEGSLLFQGGITSQRGHLGDSDGADELRSALATGLAQRRPTSVFGCAIFRSGTAPARGQSE